MNHALTRANSLYKKSQQTNGISRSLRRPYLEEALCIYRSEIRKAVTEHRPSLLRNIGTASLRLAEVIDAKIDLKLVIYHLSEAVKNFTLAWIERPDQQQTQWGYKIEELVGDCYELALRSIDGDVESQRIPNFPLLENIQKCLDSAEGLDRFRMCFHLAKAQYFYRCGVKSNEETNCAVTARLIEYSREEAQMALKYSKTRPEVIVEVERLDEDLSFLRYSCDSVRLRTQGDNLFATYFNDAEELHFDMMWDVLDTYKTAAICCREVDVENEAIAVSRQARLFDKVFKMKIRAKQYYQLAFHLAQTLFPRDLSMATWFQECKNAIERYQKETLEEEQKRKESDDRPYLVKMKKELDKLKEIHLLNDPFKLLKFVYMTHPPKVGTNTYDEKNVNSINIKKTLMKAITQYHPDKQVNFGMEWKVLCEEITKCLTTRYECMKSIS